MYIMQAQDLDGSTIDTRIQSDTFRYVADCIEKN